MRNPHGYATISDPALGGLQEFDVMTCIHSYCAGGMGGSISMTKNFSGNLEVMVFRADGTHYMKECGFCRSCMKPVCPICAGKPCSNRFKRMDEKEKAAQKFICG